MSVGDRISSFWRQGDYWSWFCEVFWNYPLVVILVVFLLVAVGWCWKQTSW